MIKMIIRNILLDQLIEVLKSLPEGTTKVDIEYVKSTEHSKLVVYPSDDDDFSTDVEPPTISPDDDIINIM